MCMLCVSPEWERGNDTSGRDAQEVNCEGQRVNSTSNRPTKVHRIITSKQHFKPPNYTQYIYIMQVAKRKS